MEREKTNLKDKLVIILAWLFAVAMLYVVFLKYRLLFHK